MSKKKITATLVILSCISLMLIVIPQAQGTQFYIATWDNPDEYGQGLDSWYAESNRTGSWLTFAFGAWDGDGDSGGRPIPWNVSQVIRIQVWTTMNRTLLGLNDTILGQNYIQHNVSVTDQWNAVVFFQQNFTCTHNQTVADLYWYRHTVILNFLPLEGEFYTVTILAEIYW